MGKRRKLPTKINIVTKVETKEKPPKCFGQKEEYCNPELCGKEWFEKCSK